MTGFVDEDSCNAQTAPWPSELAELVAHCDYREGWQIILRNEVRDPADTHGAESAGLTLSITTKTVNSYPPHQLMRVRHMFPVPPATYNRASWMRWLFERFHDVELHECMEFFTIDGEKPFAPNHGPGFDPYSVTQLTTDQARRTSFRGEVAPSSGEHLPAPLGPVTTAAQSFGERLGLDTPPGPPSLPRVPGDNPVGASGTYPGALL